LAARDFAFEEVAGVEFADIAEADDAETNFGHKGWGWDGMKTFAAGNLSGKPNFGCGGRSNAYPLASEWLVPLQPRTPVMPTSRPTPPASPARQKKLLVANRSEIAIRVMRAATELGLRTV